MLWRVASGCSNDKKSCQRRGCTFLAKDDRSVKISCSCFALCSIEAAVGRKMGTCKMDFSLHEYWCKVMCLERRPCSLFWWADVKACYLSLMFQIAQVFFFFPFALHLSYMSEMAWCDVKSSTVSRKNTKKEIHQRSTNDTLLGSRKRSTDSSSGVTCIHGFDGSDLTEESQNTWNSQGPILPSLQAIFGCS